MVVVYIECTGSHQSSAPYFPVRRITARDTCLSNIRPPFRHPILSRCRQRIALTINVVLRGFLVFGHRQEKAPGIGLGQRPSFVIGWVILNDRRRYPAVFVNHQAMPTVSSFLLLVLVSDDSQPRSIVHVYAMRLSNKLGNNVVR